MEQKEQLEPANSTEEWQAPLPPSPASSPETPANETMTLGQTLVGIFFEPGRTFSALRWNPRFLVAALIIMIAAMAFQIAFINKLGYEYIIREQLNKSPQAEQMDAAQKAKALELYSYPSIKAFIYATPIIRLVLVLGFGALIYWGASAAFGGAAGFRQSLSLVVYSSLPYWVLFALLNIIVLLLKSAEDIDPVRGQGGVLQANPGVFFDPKTNTTIWAILSSIDLLWFYGIFLAALGFQKIARLSAGSAWTIVIVLWLIAAILGVAGLIVAGGAS